MEGAAAQVGVEGGEPPGWWNSWDGADTDALVALGGGIDTIRDKLLAMDEKIGGQGLTIAGVPEPRKFKKSNQIWNQAAVATGQIRSDLSPQAIAPCNCSQSADPRPNAKHHPMHGCASLPP